MHPHLRSQRSLREGIRSRARRAACAVSLLAGLALASSGHALELDEIYGGRKHEDPEAPRVQWLDEGRAYLLEREDPDGKRRWYRVETATGAESAWLDPTTVVPVPGEPALEVDRVEFSADGKTALLAVDRERRWRRSHRARYWILQLQSGALRELDAAHRPQLHPCFSPDGERVAFVHGGDLYLAELATETVRALTADGGGTVRNGDPDWLYEEEFRYTTGLWWSPDGRRIAFLRCDDQAVEAYPLVTTGAGALPRVEWLRYPRSGSTNPELRLGIVELDEDHTRWVREFGQEAYCAGVEWLDDGRLLWQELDRPQSTLRIYLHVPEGDASRRLLEEKGAGRLRARSDLRFLEDGGFLRVSGRDGYAHVYEHGPDGEIRSRLTRGAWEVLRLLWVNEREGWVAVQTDRGNRAQRHLERVELLDGRIRRLSGSGGWHEAEFDPSGRYYVEKWSSLDRRPEWLLRTADGSLVRALQSPSMEDLATESLGRVRFLEIPTPDGLELPARLLLPEDFDASRRYPVLVHCYGGPGSQLVRDRWGGKAELFHRLLLQSGILVFSVDNRGTRGRGEDFLHATRHRLGQGDAQDQIAAADWLAEQSYVDPDRIGIWGWSYGGYLSAMSLLRGGERFRCAASVAPVSDWALYDTAWTEGYMGTPQENPEAYREGSLLTHVEGLEGSLLLLHGTTDDNVHVENTLRLAAALQEADKRFEMMLYPDEAHSIDDEQRALHLRRTLLDFFLRQLGVPPRAEARGP